MVVIKEYRVTMPMSVDEYQVAQLFAVAEVSKNETGGGEGVEVRKNEPYKGDPLFNGEFSEGQYTYKVYHLASRVPAYIRAIAPKGSLEVHEEAWNVYPYCRTILTNPEYMKDNFYIKVETYHLPDRGDSENAHKLSSEQLKSREVVPVDIAFDTVLPDDYKESEDPKKFKSVKTGRGPLVAKDWNKNVDPVMTCYKLVTVHFKWWGLQTRVENFIQSTLKRLFTNMHRQVFCWTDKWHGMTMESIRALEDKTKEELESQRRTGEIRGTKSVN
ncbi:phosphatidylinositol transfer protein beta isoform [Lepeophtheirus salmonis]|uniref:Phosphatidylinositol transfer protein beta isoform n=1 Tax=Lepeophtheirus salmonis TaxID=72036 RepID=C1BTY9_LEPSM|nr:phosphatidylinositol transfer protein beta isoform-like [Lepeophtheirus salmonis]ACO12492.1 Phosphatidylinositol transfer protein beta isoform [Lepeophtheirus salmonis]